MQTEPDASTDADAERGTEAGSLAAAAV